jgi:hypothetical protein
MQSIKNEEAVQNRVCLRLVLKSFACSACLIASIAPAVAQFPGPNPTTEQVEETMRAQASSANIQAWLQSKDPRMIAWGAYFARENNDTAALALAPQILRTAMYQVGIEAHAVGGSQYQAVLEILDTLIEQNVPVPANLLGYLSDAFPVQSAILASRLPATETASLLMQWYLDQETHRGLSRPAAMLLSKSPPPGFAANVLGNSEERLTIYIVPKPGMGFGSGNGVGGICADFLEAPALANWPELFSYRLHENDNTSGDPLLVEAGGDRITWERASPRDGFRSCSGITGLTPDTRHHLLAEMLAERDSAMSWQTHKDINIARENDQQVQRDIGVAILQEQEILTQSVQDFQTRGLITSAEAKDVRPKLSVTIKDTSSLNHAPEKP